MMKKNNSQLERAEEIQHKDLDGDGEAGEPASHRHKVLLKKGATSMAKKNPFVPPAAGKATTPPFLKTGSSAMPAKPKKGKSSKMCAPCMKSNASSCSHM